MDPLDLRAAMPAVADCAYLNTGAAGPPPRPVVEAATGFQEYHAYEAPAAEGMYDAATDLYDATRASVADLLGCAPETVALVQSTTDGINRVASALEWSADDVVVRTELEHSAGYLPWQRRRDRFGATVRTVPCPSGRLDLAAYAEAVTDASVVLLSSLTWTHGTRLPVREAVELAHEAGALVIVDAVQMPGQTRMDVREWGADVVVGAGHKWLLAPWGAGFVHVHPDAVGALLPDRIGGRGVAEHDGERHRLHPDARRLEVGTVSPAPYAGLRAAIDLLDGIGYDAIEARIRTLVDRLKAGIADDRLYSPRQFESGLVSFRVEEPEAFVERAAAADVVVRSVPTPADAVRASVHAFNDEADVDALLSLL